MRLFANNNVMAWQSQLPEPPTHSDWQCGQLALEEDLNHW